MLSLGPAQVRLFRGGSTTVQRHVTSAWPDAEIRVTGRGGDFDAALVWDAEPDEIATFAESQAGRWWLHTRSSGLPDRLIAELRGHDVLVTNGAGTHGAAVAEHVAAVLLAHYKRLPAMLDAQRERVWRPPAGIDEVGQKVVGIVGAGDLGQSIAKVLAGLGATIRALRNSSPGSLGCTRAGGGWAPQVTAANNAGWQLHGSAGYNLAKARIHGPDELHAFLSGLDVLVLAAPLTDRTRSMIGGAELTLLAAGAVVINVSRGPILSEDALVHAIESGHISAALLDVFETEPLTPSSRLWSLPNVMISPHCADVTFQTEQRCLNLLMDNIHRFRLGRPMRNIVDLARGY
jgi:phosphoglycerate dehydrogenase-like enzyme